MMIELTLPYPPSVNKIWRVGKAKVYLNPIAKAYRDQVFWKSLAIIDKFIVPVFIKNTKVRLEIKMYPPDHKRRDVDNICKSILDALQYTRIIDDDSQIYQLYVEKLEVRKGGEIEVKLLELVNN